MRTTLQEQCELFVRNVDIMRKKFKLEDLNIYTFCACLGMKREQELDAERIENCKNYIVENTGPFSHFRRALLLVNSTMLSFGENPEETFEKVQDIYELLKNDFPSSEYLVQAAFVIYRNCNEVDYEKMAKRTAVIFEMMKAEHPTLTEREDSIFAALFAISGFPKKTLLDEMERCYELLKDKFAFKNTVQSLSHVLALAEGDSKLKCERTVNIVERLKKEGVRYGRGYQLGIMGTLAMIGSDLDQEVSDIIEVSKYIQKSKAFGFFGLDKEAKIMYATMITVENYLKCKKEDGKQELSANSMNAIVCAGQLAMTAAILESTAVSSVISSGE